MAGYTAPTSIKLRSFSRKMPRQRKAALDAGLSSLEVQTDEHRQVAATLPEGVINAQGRFSLSPAAPEIMAELERLLKAETGRGVASERGAKSETASATISADLWRQLKPGSLVLAAGFDKNDNLEGWWEAIIVRVDDREFLVRWQGYPNEPRSSRSQEYIALLHPKNHWRLIPANIRRSGMNRPFCRLP
ncbi:MAG: hypothetical protein CR217_15780 [Beijerinckiaceae bacterium]|nr:MAG: hypothetical protein CR217_15780 [Beijerinckiaceae bacterium]